VPVLPYRTPTGNGSIRIKSPSRSGWFGSTCRWTTPLQCAGMCECGTFHPPAGLTFAHDLYISSSTSLPFACLAQVTANSPRRSNSHFMCGSGSLWRKLPECQPSRLLWLRLGCSACNALIRCTMPDWCFSNHPIPLRKMAQKIMLDAQYGPQ